MDIAFLCMDAAEFYSNPTLANAAWVGLDVITTFEPTGMVTLAVRAKKVGKIFDDAITILQAVDKARDLQKRVAMLPKAAKKWDSLRIVSARTGRFTKKFDGAAAGVGNASGKINGNSRASKKANHVYVIRNKITGEVHKWGISGGKIRRDGLSYRAESQVRKLNRAAGSQIFESRIIRKNITREKALKIEQGKVNEYSVSRQRRGLSMEPVEPVGNLRPPAQF